MYEARRKANGERVRPNPMYRCRGDSEQSEGSSSEAESEIVMQGECMYACPDEDHSTTIEAYNYRQIKVLNRYRCL